MHEGIEKRLEEYLEGSREESALAAVREHLERCHRCRREVEDMSLLANLLKSLRPAEPVDADPGFYARVMQRIEAQRRLPVLYAFLDPGFARRLILASLAAAVGFGSYLVYAERTPVFSESNPVAIIASGTAPDDLMGADPARDRETVLLALTSYQE